MSNPMIGTANAKQCASKAHEARRNGSFAKLTVIQGHIMARLEQGKLTATELAKLTGALVESEKLKRVMRGLPANTSQSIKSEPKQRKSRVSGPVEPVEVVEPVKVSVSPSIEPAPVNQAVSQPDSQSAKSTGAWKKAMGQDDPSEQV